MSKNRDVFPLFNKISYWLVVVLGGWVSLYLVDQLMASSKVSFWGIGKRYWWIFVITACVTIIADLVVFMRKNNK